MCRNEATDVVFLVDQSGSIGPDNFELMTQFVTNVISTLNVGEDTTRVAVRTFSIESKKHFALADYDEDLVEESKKVRQKRIIEPYLLYVLDWIRLC